MMSKKIYGGLDVTHNVTVNGKRTIQGINKQVFDENGNMVLDTYSKNEMNDIIGMLPISHYGSMNYLPAGVGGDFNGASENQAYRRNKVLLENDGTLVLLRSGTNGSVEGLYYSYLSNALAVTDMSRTINTSRQYKPGFFGPNRVALGLFNTDQNIIMGRYKDISNNTIGTFISITNGTLNDTLHTGFFVNQTDISPEGGVEYAMMAEDGSIYVFNVINENNKFEIAIVKVVFNVDNGSYTATRITGWTTKTFYNTTYSGQNNIVITNAMTSTNIADKPYVFVPPNLYGMGIYMTSIDLYVAQQPGTQNFRFRMNGDAYFAMPTYSSRPQHNYSFTFDMNSKQCTLDAGNDIGSFQAPLVITNTGSDLVASGNVLNLDPLYDHNGYRNIYSSYFYLNSGDVFCTACPNLAEPLAMQKAKFPVQIVYNMLNVRAVISSNFIGGIVRPSFGSAVGSYINGVELLPDNSTKQYSRASGSGGFSPSYAVHKSTPNFTFQSLSLGTIQGYEPTTERKNVSENNNNRIFISTVSGSTVTTNGGIFMVGQRYSQSLSFDKNLNGTGSISVSQSVLDGFRDSEYAKVLSDWNLSPQAGKDMTLFVPQQADIPAFVMLSTITNDFKNYIRIAEVNVNTRVGEIKSITFKRLVLENRYGDSFTPNVGGYIAPSSVGLTIYDGGSFYFIGGSDPLTHPTIGNTATHIFRAYVNKSSAQFESFIIDGIHAYYNQGRQFTALPDIGFGYFDTIDYDNKMIFRKCGTTIEEYNNWKEQGNPINVVSQDVAQGFVVYFTEETPVILSGKSFTLPVSNIDLRTIKPNPANTTFHVYVKLKQGLVTYHITTDVISETGTIAYNILWIGTIRTNDIQIVSIDIQKRSRLDIFGASLEAAGVSFPVSYGLPSQTGTINW
ncbi:hypothetical protein UES1_449 [Escherichia phage UE-S1]|nr:hypothetical protein UES1_449 [Escherichia phage UE-S1]